MVETVSEQGWIALKGRGFSPAVKDRVRSGFSHRGNDAYLLTESCSLQGLTSRRFKTKAGLRR